MPTYRYEPERPRHEPEIIPPDRNTGRSTAWSPWHSFNQTRSRIYVTRIGLLAFLILGVGLFAGVLLLAMIGGALIWVPVAAVLIVAAIGAVPRVNMNYRKLGTIAFIAGVALSIIGFVFLATRSLTPFEALILIGAFYLAWQWLRLNIKSVIGSLLVRLRYR